MASTINRNDAEARYQRWRRADIEHVIKLKASGMTWPQIVQKIGRSSPRYVQKIVSDYKRGLAKLRVEEHDRLREIFLREALEGSGFREIARRHGQHPSFVWNTLSLLGYDKETIQEERDLLNATVSGHAQAHSGQRAA